MTFHSILFRTAEDKAKEGVREAPDHFADLNLDQIIDAITAGKEEYDLKPFFYAPSRDTETVAYRHDVMRDLEGPALRERIESFAQQMRGMRGHLSHATKRRHQFEKARWFLDAVDLYCDAVSRLDRDLSAADVKAQGFLAFREYLATYARSDRFTSLMAHTKTLKRELSSVTYCVLMRDNSVTVRRCESESDYSTDVLATFAKFKQGAVKGYAVDFSDLPDMNHIEAKVLDFVAQLYPEIFLELGAYCNENGDYADGVLTAFDREVQFYLAYLEYVSTFKRAGLAICYPGSSIESKNVHANESFDFALAHKLLAVGAPVVCNDFFLKGKERIIIVSGPNQGGKTTFARTFGQLHYLAALGCPVAGRDAQLWLSDRIFTHFEKEESLDNLRGKLEDDLVRIHQTLQGATSDSVIIMNEMLTSTTSSDASALAKRVMEKIIRLDALCVFVTFIDELASMSEKTVSMVSTVAPDNPALRTYKVIRMRADGLAYAISIAEKYRLTYERLKERLGP